jgi:hypothetical protein
MALTFLPLELPLGLVGVCPFGNLPKHVLPHL